jgi:hypothetical protein
MLTPAGGAGEPGPADGSGAHVPSESHGSASRAGAARDEFRWQRRLSPGSTLEIKGVYGDVHAEVAASDEAEVIGVKSAKHSDPGAVELKVLEHADGVTICALYPGGDGAGPNECRPGEEGRMHVHDNDVRINFTVRVPRGVRFVGRTVNGDVEARSLRSNVEAYAVIGNVRISTSGYAQAKTINGSIDASLGTADWLGRLTFQTVNGALTITLPAGVGTEIQASTVNGDIASEFELRRASASGNKNLSGVIGEGGRQLFLKTTNGAIKLRRMT